ncbi:alpha-amylase family protein [Sphingobacterium sp. SGR-19]|uniref:alpha-amylase family protein n=1 Tax=Sphingobacterium sp. SGR-19 TaxID=2710886 RepID=UPI0013ED44DC|nr:alpha-amylase family protein [Sphingobacterium sp. SGR-19]NGM64240.1 trehalose synthase [Sphingobacterium sp. SGR-19]
MSKNLWYKNAIIYALAIESFKDSDADGSGDFRGLQQSLDYFRILGIDCLWLLPFYDSPNKDDGYDVRNYYEVDKRFGDLGDFAKLVDAAKAAGLRIIIDLVVNHTSKEHPWFLEAANNPHSVYRNYYIWSNEKPEENGSKAILAEEQGYTNWTYSKEADAFYYHTFYNDQPDLNMTNPAVVEEVKKIMRFWLKLGVDGFRIDAAPHMIEQKGNCKFDGDPHDIFREWRAYIEELNSDAVFLAEVDVPPKRYTDFLEHNKQMHMLFNFYLNNYFFLAFAREEAEPIATALQEIPLFSEEEQLANFLRNHDELDLEQLSEAERQKVFDTFAPKEDMRIFDRGIRRRLPPMFDNNRSRLAMAYSILFSLPGTPVIRYGQEIGMGDDLQKDGRQSVRTLMQWNAGKNGGFSEVTAGAMDEDIIAEGPYSYKKVNVNKQLKDDKSLLNTIRRFIHARKNMDFQRGKFTVLNTSSKHCLAYRYEFDKRTVFILQNLSDQPITVSLESDHPERYHVVVSDKKYSNDTNNKQRIDLNPYGYRWLIDEWIF